MAESDVEKIKDRLSIVDVVGQYVTLKRAGRTFMARCPFHNEKTPSFHVSPERGTYKCFGCGEGGDIFTFVEKMEGIDFPTALKQLAEKAGVKLERQAPAHPQDVEKDDRLREVCEETLQFFESKLGARPDVLDYLHTRGVSDESIKTWRLGYAPASWDELSKHLLSKGFTKNEIVEAGFAVRSEKKQGEIFDRFRGRIMFPIFDPTGRPIAVSGRFFERVSGQKEDTEPAKYVNSPETALFKKSKALYGFDHAKNSIRKADCILLVEGQFDLVMAHQSGLPFTVALSGTALTPEHLSLLSRLSKRLVLALDADDAGVRAGLRSAEMALRAGFDVKVPTFPEGKDPADIARENPELLKAAIRTSRTAVEFFLDALRGALPAGRQGDERSYQKIIEAQVLPLVRAIESKIEQEHFIHIIAQKLNVSEAAVQAEVAKQVVSRYEEADEAPSQSVSQQLIEHTPLERAVAMLAFRPAQDEAVKSRLTELLGKERLEGIEAKLGSEAEKIRFEFDMFGGEEAEVVKDLLGTIERKITQEKIYTLQSRLRQGSEAEQGPLLKELSTLKRREQELRQ